jgi:hypothetical protein
MTCDHQVVPFHHIVREQRWVTQGEIVLVGIEKQFQVGRDSRKGRKKKVNE